MNPKQKEEWKRRIFERVKKEVYHGMDWEAFSQQVDEFVFIYGGEGILRYQGPPPHGKYEIWLPDKLESELMKEYKAAAQRENASNNE